MKHSIQTPQQVGSISALHALLKLEMPTHPLVSVVKLSDIETDAAYVEQTIAYPFYCIALLKNEDDSIKYGQQPCDFAGAAMTFAAPRQLVSVTAECITRSEGYMLIIHPDFLHSYPLASKIKSLGFFSYQSQEALHLSGQEEVLVTEILKNLSREMQSSIDAFSQDVLVAHIELLLS